MRAATAWLWRWCQRRLHRAPIGRLRQATMCFSKSCRKTTMARSSRPSSASCTVRQQIRPTRRLKDQHDVLSAQHRRKEEFAAMVRTDMAPTTRRKTKSVFHPVSLRPLGSCGLFFCCPFRKHTPGGATCFVKRTRRPLFPLFSLQFRHLQGHFHEMQGSPSGCWVKVFVLQGVNDPPLLERAGRKTRFCSEDINALRGNLRSFPFLRRPFSGGQNPGGVRGAEPVFIAY